MNAKNLVILVVVTAVAALGAVMTLPDGDASVGLPERAPLFEGLGERVNDVAKIELERKEESLTLEKVDGRWTVTERGGYPAKLSEIKKAATFVSDLEIEETKSDKPKYHAKLGVQEPDAEESESTRVTLYDAGGARMASVVASTSQYRGRNPKVYVRRSGEDQVYLCDGGMDLNLGANTWIETSILKIPADRVSGVRITHADGEVVRVSQVEENPGQFTIDNLPEGREEKYAGVANPVGSALAALSLEDVRPVDAVDFTAEPVAETLYRTDDGLVLSIDTARLEDKVWMRVRTAYEAPPTPAAPAEGEEGAPPLDAADPEAVQAEVESLRAALGPWAFAVPSYRADSLTRRMEELLAELPVEEPGAEDPASGAGTDGFEANPQPLAEPPFVPVEETPPPVEEGGEGSDG